ncbi:ribonuclease hi [Plakobranchus ocellatus]|uniref:Ribonuclease hi n=1 Tax=Plakobranchus ocellatus TaxID=259542 RepID=A0AAV4D1A5_9GAST|nr:ribonuclease hi [Plakobranchus ocellatus]
MKDNAIKILIHYVMEEKVAAAAFSPERPERLKATRLRYGASVFSAELEGIAIELSEENWDTEGANKLLEVLPYLGEDLHKRGEGAGRKRETVMSRLRTGHTWLTQSYLSKNEEQPFCYACDSLYTARHILIECPDFQVTRSKYFSVTDLYRLFREANPSRIVSYIKELGVHGNI